MDVFLFPCIFCAANIAINRHISTLSIQVVYKLFNCRENLGILALTLTLETTTDSLNGFEMLPCFIVRECFTTLDTFERQSLKISAIVQVKFVSLVFSGALRAIRR